MDELISVIVPVYNIESYLPRCLDCIAMQTYRNLEIILVDDGSTDESGRLCDEFASRDSRAKVIHQQNCGLWAARNAGQDAATGDYLWFPDGDDYFHQDILRVMYSAINQKDGDFGVAMVGYKETMSPEEDVTTKTNISIRPILNNEMYENWAFRKPKALMSFIWNKLFRRKLVSDIRTGNYKFGQDRDFNAKVCQKGTNAVYIENELYYWVQRSSSAMHSVDYWYYKTKCDVLLSFDNYIKDPLHFQYYLIPIYIGFDSLLLRSFQLGENKKMVRFCHSIEKKTVLSFLFNCGKMPMEKRIKIFFKVSFPYLYYRILYNHI